jgi:hypothetical protein
MLYAVPGVEVADSREALKALIDRSPVPSDREAAKAEGPVLTTPPRRMDRRPADAHVLRQ